MYTKKRVQYFQLWSVLTSTKCYTSRKILHLCLSAWINVFISMAILLSQGTMWWLFINSSPPSASLPASPPFSPLENTPSLLPKFLSSLIRSPPSPSSTHHHSLLHVTETGLQTGLQVLSQYWDAVCSKQTSLKSHFYPSNRYLKRELPKTCH